MFPMQKKKRKLSLIFVTYSMVFLIVICSISLSFLHLLCVNSPLEDQGVASLAINDSKFPVTPTGTRIGIYTLLMTSPAKIEIPIHWTYDRFRINVQNLFPITNFKCNTAAMKIGLMRMIVMKIPYFHEYPDILPKPVTH